MQRVHRQLRRRGSASRGESAPISSRFGGFIAADSSAAADRVYDRLESRITLIAEFPNAGPARPDTAEDARMVVERPYLILYRTLDGGVQIVRILHDARDIGAALFRADQD